MDCEKFEAAMLDELYGELDELTSAAAKRHVSGCARCSRRLADWRTIRRLAGIRWVEPPRELEERILSAVDRAPAAPPPRPGLARAISLAGTWAMRPQTAMAAVFLVMVATSVLLLRGKSAHAPVSERVRVTEHGTPAPAPRADDGGGAFDAAMTSYRAGRFDEAAREFDALGTFDASAALWAARSVREGRGCAAAVDRFDRAARQAGASITGWDALLEGGRCYRRVGDAAQARTRLASLLGVDAYRERARAELAAMERTPTAPTPHPTP